MTDFPAKAERLFYLADVVWDGHASEDDLAELDDILLADESLHSDYVEYCQMHAVLGLDLQAQRAARKSRQQIGFETNAPGSAISLPSVAQAESGLPGPGFLGSAGLFSSGWPVAYLVATVIVGIGLAIGAFTHVSQPRRIALESPPPVAPVVRTATESVGRITAMVNCTWAGATADSASVLPGRKYELTSGLLEITYDSGATVILEGPATYEALSKNAGLLSLGKITGRAESESCKGFSVRTPTAVVTDLGTEFGVEVGNEGATHTEVFAGRVEVAPIDVEGVRRESRTLAAGEWATVAKKLVMSVGASDADGRNAKRFVRALPSTEPDQAASYARLVLSMRPTAYYRMEPPADRKDRDVLFDSAAGGRHGAYFFSAGFPGQPYPPGRYGHSLHYRGPMVGDYARVPDCPAVTKHPLTVSVWAYLAGGPDGRGIICQSESFTLSVHATETLGGCLEALVTQFDGAKHSVVVASEQHAFPLRTWQHVAMVIDGTRLRLYRNGVEAASRPCPGVRVRAEVAPLAIGFLGNDDLTKPSSGSPYYWRGRLDELAIYDRALPPEEIQQLSAGAPTRHVPDSTAIQPDKQ